MTDTPAAAAALRNISASVLDVLQTRLSLLVNEIQIQKQLWVQQLWLALGLLFCLALALLLLVALVLLLWWEQRFWVLGFFVLLFSALSLYFWAVLRRNRVQESPLLACSLAELQEDVRQLRQAAGHEPPSR